MKRYEVVILGAGSAGEAIARQLRIAGKTVALVEKLRVGGECAYLSCMPSKAMLRSSQVRRLIARAVELGASPENISLVEDSDAFEWAAKRRDRIAVNRDDSVASAELIEMGIDLYRGAGSIVGGSEVAVGDTTLHFTDLVISTGSTSTIPKIEGLSDIPYWTSDDALSTATAPASIAIIGGGPVACELAQIFSRFGTETTIIEFSHQLAGKEHSEIASRLAENLRGDGVTVHLSTEVKSVKKVHEEKIELILSTGAALQVNQVIVAAGRHPQVADIGLENISIGLNEKRAISIDSDGRVTGNLHIWACGDVTGIAPFTHTANYQAKVITENILGGARQANYEAIPRAIYTDPPVASVGDMKVSISDSRFVYATVELETLSRLETDGEAGGLLILAADLIDGRLIGASAIGPHADEWIAEATLAIRSQTPLSILEDLVHPFPTFSQAYEEAYKKLAAASRIYSNANGR